MTITETTIKLYTYEDLPSDKAKQAARDWYLSDGFEVSDAFNNTKEDAEQIGLKIVELPIAVQGVNEGEFIDGAFNCMNKILAEHGKDCETYKTAAKYKAAWDEVPDQITNLEEESRNAESLDAIEHEFLCDLLEDYRVMLTKEIEYRQSDEVVEEALEINSYTFRANGKREDAEEKGDTNVPPIASQRTTDEPSETENCVSA